MEGKTIMERALNRAMAENLTAVRIGDDEFRVPGAPGKVIHTVRHSGSRITGYECTCPVMGMCKHIAAVMMLVCEPAAAGPD